MSNDRKQDGLDFLTEFLVEEVMSATDDEIQTEVEKEGRDIEQIASNVRSIYERAFADVGKNKLMAAKSAVSQQRESKPSGKVAKVSNLRDRL